MRFAGTPCLAHLALSRYKFDKKSAPLQVKLAGAFFIKFASLVETRIISLLTLA